MGYNRVDPAPGEEEEEEARTCDEQLEMSLKTA